MRTYILYQDIKSIKDRAIKRYTGLHRSTQSCKGENKATHKSLLYRAIGKISVYKHCFCY